MIFIHLYLFSSVVRIKTHVKEIIPLLNFCSVFCSNAQITNPQILMSILSLILPKISLKIILCQSFPFKRAEADERSPHCTHFEQL